MNHDTKFIPSNLAENLVQLKRNKSLSSDIRDMLKGTYSCRMFSLLYDDRKVLDT